MMNISIPEISQIQSLLTTSLTSRHKFRKLSCQVMATQQYVRIWLSLITFFICYGIVNGQVGYHFVDMSLNWSMAESHCQDTCNSHLASIHSQSEYEQINDLIRTSTSEHRIWFGLNDIENEMQFVYTDGSPFDFASDITIPGTFPWARDSPSHGGNNVNGDQDCGDLIFDKDAGYYDWNDDECYETYPFICNDCIDSTREPTLLPSTSFPTNSPSTIPSITPSMAPSEIPTSAASSDPSQHPTTHPTISPSEQPTKDPTTHPTSFPSAHPSTEPTSDPSEYPTMAPSGSPTTNGIVRTPSPTNVTLDNGVIIMVAVDIEQQNQEQITSLVSNITMKLVSKQLDPSCNRYMKATSDIELNEIQITIKVCDDSAENSILQSITGDQVYRSELNSLAAEIVSISTNVSPSILPTKYPSILPSQSPNQLHSHSSTNTPSSAHTRNPTVQLTNSETIVIISAPSSVPRQHSTLDGQAVQSTTSTYPVPSNYDSQGSRSQSDGIWLFILLFVAIIMLLLVVCVIVIYMLRHRQTKPKQETDSNINKNQRVDEKHKVSNHREYFEDTGIKRVQWTSQDRTMVTSATNLSINQMRNHVLNAREINEMKTSGIVLPYTTYPNAKDTRGNVHVDVYVDTRPLQSDETKKPSSPNDDTHGFALPAITARSGMDIPAWNPSFGQTISNDGDV